MKKQRSIMGMRLPFLNDNVSKLNDFDLVNIMLNYERFKIKRHQYVKRLSGNGLTNSKLIRKLKI
jgi:hypothetical protein